MKKVLKAIFLYFLATSFLYMFAVSYSNSYNRINSKKISPAVIVINGGNATVNILHDEFTVDFRFLEPESRFYYFLYFLSPDSFHSAERILIESIGRIS